MKDLIIYGAGGFGREVAWLVERINKETPIWNLCGFVDDDCSLWEAKVDDYVVLGGIDYIAKNNRDIWVVLAVGNSAARKQIVSTLASFQHIHFATLIDPSVQMSNRVAIGEGSIICTGNIVTTDVKIGDHCIINLDCTIGHDAVLESFATLYPSVNVSGAVTIGTVTEIGTGTAIIQRIKIGNHTIIGAHSTVVRDVDSNVTVVGSPARVIKRRDTNSEAVNDANKR